MRKFIPRFEFQDQLDSTICGQANAPQRMEHTYFVGSRAEPFTKGALSGFLRHNEIYRSDVGLKTSASR
jgi:hypothetical protein